MSSSSTGRTENKLSAYAFFALIAALAGGQTAHAGPPKRIACDTGKAECPSWVAQVEARGLLESRLCTGALVAPDLVSTNAHCLEPSMRVSGASCRGIVDFAFPATGHLPEQVVGCDHIETVRDAARATEDPALKDDSVLFRLTQPVQGRTPVPLSSEGFKDHEKVQIVKVDQPQAAGDLAWVRTEECEIRYNTLAFPGEGSPGSEFTGLVGCKVHHGNSGSAALVDGKMRGIVTAIMSDEKAPATQKLKFENFGFSYVVNLACRVAEGAWPLASAGAPCTSRKEELYFGPQFQGALESQPEAMAQFTEALRKTGDTAFDWQTFFDAPSLDTLVLYATPVCSEDLDEFTEGAWSGPVAQVPVVKFDVEIDSTSYHFTVHPQPMQRANMVIFPRQEQGVLLADFRIDVPADLGPGPLKGTLGTCSAMSAE